jgi:hypothetical protein
MRRISFAILILCTVGAGLDLYGNDSANPGSVTGVVHLGGGSAIGQNRGASLHAGVGIHAGIGQHLSLGLAPSYTGFVETMPNSAAYFADLPISMTGYFRASESVKLAVSGGVGIGFSDLPAWRKSNRALTGHLGCALSLRNSDTNDLWLELRMVKAATSTANVTFGFLVLKYSVGI